LLLSLILMIFSFVFGRIFMVKVIEKLDWVITFYLWYH
jgi:hypothetical protein